MSDEDSNIIGPSDSDAFDLKNFIQDQVKDVDKELETHAAGPKFIPKHVVQAKAAEPPEYPKEDENGEHEDEDAEDSEEETEASDEVARSAKTEEDAERNLKIRLAEVERILNEFRAGRAGVRVSPPPRKIELDWSKITEKDVYDFSIPIEAIEHSLPDAAYMPLIDPDYVARLCSTHKRIMALRKAQGYTFVTTEDIDHGQFMGMNIEPDENGQYAYGDCVYMKIHKKRYFGKMRANQIKATAMINTAKAHQIGKAQITAQYENDFQIADAYHDYTKKNKLEVYVPGEV